ncbi:DUF2332 domain-containing protein [Iamia sp. SCSIO 61187]|uniref:DUF2332 domain-containing protein n=1 Tax=Iamia sp. SCSIO 61187 TaxID=2722752 RepID=UPI001C62D870|nr:DUF2332 domain-containing protein [Iamia sp. SCSIO 61187]QYG93911.1 DUF2332 domain-containing protein [Iamia sp. SCSIO 61187]
MAGDLEGLVRAQRRGCAIGGSALYERVLDAVLDDLAVDGPCRTVLTPYAAEPHARATVLRFLAAVHELVLDGRAPALAAQYPSAGGTSDETVGAVFVATVAEHVEDLVARTGAPIQTNEVGRSAALLGGFLLLAATGLPLRVLEVGASAGLNLRFDHLRYEAGGEAFGPPSSPVRFVDPWTGGRPRLDAHLEVLDRRGCDLSPLDPTVARDRLRLRACLWPDQPDRRTRLDGALEVAAAVPVAVDRADAAEWAAEQLADPVPGAVTVVVHTIVTQYLRARTRTALEDAVRAAGDRATAAAPVAWLCMEPATETEAEVRLTLWPKPAPVRTHVVARSAFHGPPVRWLAG